MESQLSLPEQFYFSVSLRIKVFSLVLVAFSSLLYLLFVLLKLTTILLATWHCHLSESHWAHSCLGLCCHVLRYVVSCSICAAVDVCMYALQHLCVALFWIGLCHSTENSQRTEIAHLCSLHTLYTILHILSFLINLCHINSLFKLMSMVC